jgi:hypothetical protein
MAEIARIIWDFAIPSQFSTDKSHSTPVPVSVTFIIGTLADTITSKAVTCPLPATQKQSCYNFYNNFKAVD